MAATWPGALLVLALWAPAPRGAPAPEEQKAFAEGLRLFEAGDARGAERSWKRGYAVRGDPAFLVRIGEALERLGETKAAREQYERYLRESPSAADRAEIEARVRRLSPAPSPTAPDPELRNAELRPDPAAGGSEPGAPPAGRPDRVTNNASTNTAPQPGTSAAPAAAQPGVPEHVAQAPDAELRAYVDDRRPARSTLSVLGWTGVGVTVALLGTAAFFGASAAENADDLNRLLLHRDERTGQPAEYSAVADEYEKALADGRRDDRWATAFAIGAGATAVAAAVFFVFDGLRGSATAADTLAARERSSSGRPARLRPRLGSAGPARQHGVFGPALVLGF